jgi:hypothetical protein
MSYALRLRLKIAPALLRETERRPNPPESDRLWVGSQFANPATGVPSERVFACWGGGTGVPRKRFLFAGVEATALVAGIADGSDPSPKAARAAGK